MNAWRADILSRIPLFLKISVSALGSLSMYNFLYLHCAKVPRSMLCWCHGSSYGVSLTVLESSLIWFWTSPFSMSLISCFGPDIWAWISSIEEFTPFLNPLIIPAESCFILSVKTFRIACREDCCSWEDVEDEMGLPSEFCLPYSVWFLLARSLERCMGAVHSVNWDRQL